MKDTLSITEWAEQAVEQLTADVKEYVELGWDIEEAIDKVKSGSVLSEKYFMKVVENVFSK